MHVAIDAVGIRGHGGAAVLCELLCWLPVVRPKWKWHVFLLDRSMREFEDPTVSEQVSIESTRTGDKAIGRLIWVNRNLGQHLKILNADILFSFANIGPARPITPQVVFCHQPNAFLLEGLTSFSFFRRARLRFMRDHILRGARASQAMIVQTEAMRNRILELEPSLRERIHVIPSGYRTPSENPVIRPEKKSLIDNAGKPRLIYVSHPSEHKNHVALIRAMQGILKVFPSASLLLTIEKERLSYKKYSFISNRIQTESESIGISRNVVFLGLLNPDEVAYALGSSDLTVFPSLAESFGLGLVESIAASCPVAAADLPYAHDVCGDAAVYFNPNDPREIARTVVDVCRDKSTLDQLRSIGANRKDRYSYRRIAEEIAHVFELVKA